MARPTLEELFRRVAEAERELRLIKARVKKLEP